VGILVGMDRLVLFDIDCTLIDAGGAGGRSLMVAIREVYGVGGSLDGYTFHGRTDPAIVRDLVMMWGIEGHEVDGRLDSCLDRYAELVQTEVLETGVTVLPGIRDLVAALTGDPGIVVGLLTGNVEAGARSKLHPTGLLSCFRLGAYGSDAERRDDLPAIAVERARALTGRTFTGKSIVVIGDTPADVSCGAHLGVKSVAVATGKHSVVELAAAGADHVFGDFSDWREAHAAIAS